VTIHVSPEAQSVRVGFVGLGRMGLPMCSRLIAAGFAVTASDLRGELRSAAAGAGARWAESGAGAAGDAELLITMLPGPREVAAAAEELIGALTPGTTWIDMSTASPLVARGIGPIAARRGVRVLDAPVGGNPDEARRGELLAFVGGAEADLRRWRPVLEVLARRLVPVGPAGSGYAIKLLINALWFSHAVASAEVLALASRLGLDLERVRSALTHSAATSRFLERDAVALLAGDDLTTFSLARCCEELASALALGSELEVPVDVLSAVTDVHRSALERYGDVDGELLGARLVAERAGVQLRHR